MYSNNSHSRDGIDKASTASRDIVSCVDCNTDVKMDARSDSCPRCGAELCQTSDDPQMRYLEDNPHEPSF